MTFDLILLSNFRDHIDRKMCNALLRKVKAGLAGGSQALAVDFVKKPLPSSDDLREEFLRL